MEGRGGGGKKRWKRRGGEEGATSLMIHFKTAATRSGRRNEKSLFECRFFFFGLSICAVYSVVPSVPQRYQNVARNVEHRERGTIAMCQLGEKEEGCDMLFPSAS